MYNRPVFLVPKLMDGLLLRDESFSLSVDNENDMDLVFELLEDCENLKEFHLHNPDLEKLWKMFLRRFNRVEAGGGVVRNTKDELLCIKRNGLWDLPKGKIDRGETIEEGAVREVSEECGITGLRLGKKLEITYHVYTLRGEEILKPTHWFEMDYSGDEPLVPQEAEGITEVTWMNASNLTEILENTHPTLINLFKSFFNRPTP